MNDYDYIIQQLDLLIGLLDVSKLEVFEQIKNHDSYNTGISVGKLYENSYENYSNHFCNATVLLGASHFEDFIGKCIKKILIDNPNLNKYKVDYSLISNNGDNIIDFLAEEQVKRMNVSDMLKFANKNVRQITNEMDRDMNNYRELRNCLIHNNGIADERVSFLGIPPKQKIKLDSDQLHGYGLAIRGYVNKLWEHIESS